MKLLYENNTQMNRDFKGKIMKLVCERQLYSIMNDTKWNELFSAVNDLKFPPPFQMKLIHKSTPEPEKFDIDVWYLGDWSVDSWPLFFSIEWICVRPRYTKYRGRLVEDEVIDETQEFISILQRYSIPFEEDKGVIMIYGYK